MNKPKIIQVELGMSYMYGSPLECVKDKYHLKTTDAEGHCNLCSYKDTPEEILSFEAHNFALLCLDQDTSTYLDDDGQIIPTKVLEQTVKHLDLITVEPWLIEKVNDAVQLWTKAKKKLK